MFVTNNYFFNRILKTGITQMISRKLAQINVTRIDHLTTWAKMVVNYHSSSLISCNEVKICVAQAMCIARTAAQGFFCKPYALQKQ